MGATYFALNRYKAMWLFVCFDLPVTTKEQRRVAARFRKDLLQDGFSMLQFSVYIRPCPSHESYTVHLNRVKALIPPEGSVSLIRITDKQFGEIANFYGSKRKKPPPEPMQLELF